MSRVHEALRRAQQQSPAPPATTPAPSTGLAFGSGASSPPESGAAASISTMVATPTKALVPDDLLSLVATVPFRPDPDAPLIDLNRPHEAPMEEFRTLRTRLNHLQTQQHLHTLVVSSPSPAEGKSFAAVNLALAEAQLQDNRTLICDLDLRRPVLHRLFQVDRSPGITELLQGKAAMSEVIRHVEGTNLYIAPAGGAVVNPLELLNLSAVPAMLHELPRLFNWVILDTPPLLFAADANLLSTLTHGTILVVRIGTTTIDSVKRAMASLCNNNVLGTVVNGARRGELYSKYTYYHSYYEEDKPAQAEKAEDE